MKKMLITGSEGFIGAYLKEHFKGKYEIIKFDIKLSIFQDVRITKYVHDFVKKHKPDIIIHLAANPEIPASVENPQEDLVLNTTGTINMLEAAKEVGTELFIFTSTAQVYGEPKQASMNEDHPLSPKSPYAIGKLASERYCRFYYERFNVPTVVFRFFNIYGPNQPSIVVVPALIDKISKAKGSLDMFGSKEDSRDFVFVRDLCSAFEKAIEKKPLGETIHFGSGKETKICDLAKTIAKILGKDIKFNYSENVDKSKITRMVADVGKARKLLGWEAKISLEDGLKEVIRSKGI